MNISGGLEMAWSSKRLMAKSHCWSEFTRKEKNIDVEQMWLDRKGVTTNQLNQ